MTLYDKNIIDIFKINGKSVVVKYDEYKSDKYELFFEGEINKNLPYLYYYNFNGGYIFGHYIQYKNSFKNLAELNIEKKIFEFIIRKTTNIK